MKFQQIKPKPARKKFKEKMWDDPDYWAEPKLDGHRAVAQFTKKGVRFTSRHQSVKTNKMVENTESLPHLTAPVEALVGCVLDGEIIVPGGSDAMKVTSIMGSKPERAIKLQEENGCVEYYVFDILFLYGKDVRKKPLKKRRKLMRAVVSLWRTKLRQHHDSIFARRYVQVVKKTRNHKRQMLEDIFKSGGEGVILKDRNAAYGENWAKVKKVATYDVIVMGYTDAKEKSEKVSGKVSKTKYKGMVGAIVFGQYATRKTGKTTTHDIFEFGQTSGFTDELREELTKNGDKYVGKVMEIKAQERLSSGKFRHPQFVRWRKDKRARDCTYRDSEL